MQIANCKFLRDTHFGAPTNINKTQKNKTQIKQNKIIKELFKVICSQYTFLSKYLQNHSNNKKMSWQRQLGKAPS